MSKAIMILMLVLEQIKAKTGWQMKILDLEQQGSQEWLDF